ncbi:hypothetical protein BGX23_011584 [Mortierella sp. AD031]|nr:hypothetical protein BGX23_011584 [Mortierella sp. AD031]
MATTVPSEQVATTVPSEQVATHVKPPLAMSYSSTNSIPQSSSSPTPGAQGGFPTTVRNAATDILGISPTTATAAPAETNPNGPDDSSSNINRKENAGEDARRLGNTSGDVPPTITTTATTTTAEDQGMVSIQPEAMTMEAFQMNGGSIQYEPYEADDNNQTVYAAQGGGPGSFPESNGTDSQEYAYNGRYTPAESTSSQNDGEDYSAANISFVYANEKRFSDFHSVFRSVPDEEKLIEDYGCALQKEILVQGRLYISENHVCFNANIFGWVTNLVIAFSEITAIEKRLTAFVIPNAISIVTTTNTKGHFFASFLSRDAAHDLLMAAWRKSFPCAANASAANNNAYFRQNRSNVTVNDDDDADSFISARPASDSRRNRHRRSSSASQNWTADEAEWDETGEDMDGKSSVGPRRRGSKRATVKKILKDVVAPILPSDDDGRNGIASEGARTGRGRSVSELPPRPTSFDFMKQTNPSSKSTFDLEDKPQKARAGSESNGNGTVAVTAGAPSGAGANRSPTTCKCSKDGRHYANSFMSETYPGTVESMWKLLFDSNFSKRFLTNEAMKGADVQEEAWKSAGDGTSTKITKYTKWLGMPIGPKTTKAILTDVCEYKNFDEYVTTVTTTSTPDVPSGGSFTTKCRTCITWAGPNQVQVVVTGAVEFTKSSWIKGQIEKGAAEGMGTHYKELNQSIRKHIAAHPDESGGGGSGAATPASDTHRRTGATPPSGTSTPTHERQRAKRDHQQHAPAQPSIENGKPDKGPAVAAAQQSSGKSGTNGGAAGLLSGIMASFSASTDGEGASHMALMSVLALVMLANIYIWFQISSVTSQIEKIQGDVFAGQRGGGRSYMAPQPRNTYTGMDYDGYGDSAYTRDQEEAMWAWLTEREERYHRYQRASAGRDWSRMRKEETNDNDSFMNDPTSSSSSSSSAALTEAKLQARINELQQQLEALEKAMERGTQQEL